MDRNSRMGVGSGVKGLSRVPTRSTSKARFRVRTRGSKGCVSFRDLLPTWVGSYHDGGHSKTSWFWGALHLYTLGIGGRFAWRQVWSGVCLVVDVAWGVGKKVGGYDLRVGRCYWDSTIEFSPTGEIAMSVSAQWTAYTGAWGGTLE